LEHCLYAVFSSHRRGFLAQLGGPLSDEITGSLLNDLEDDAGIAAALRRGPFEDAFPGFQPPNGPDGDVARHRRFQQAIVDMFSRLNKTYVNRQFEF
jgi:hypothetical protein